MGDEFLVASKEHASASRNVRVRLSLLGLLLGCPEPSLVGVDGALDDASEKDASAFDRAVRQLVDQLVKFRLGDDPNSDTASRSPCRRGNGRRGARAFRPSARRGQQRLGAADARLGEARRLSTEERASAAARNASRSGCSRSLSLAPTCG